MPSAKSFRIRHLQFSLTDRLSACAKDARMESISSPSPLEVSIFSFSNTMATPSAFISRTISRSVTVFRAKRLRLLVSTRSIFPARQSASRR